MDKAKAQSLREVLSDVFANVEGREKYIKKDWKKSVRETNVSGGDNLFFV